MSGAVSGAVRGARALAALLLLPVGAALAQGAVGTEGDFVIRDARFADGSRLPELRIHYTTLGRPRRDAAGVVRNAVLVLHGTTGSGRGFLAPAFAGELFGPGQLLDTAAHYVILPDGIGTGRSSKPSDGLRARFPRYGYADMVAAQHRLVTEGLKVNHLLLVMGTSMGGMHTWMWGERYPDFMDGLVPLASAPTEIAGRNRMMRAIISDGIRGDPAWRGGEYASPPRGLRTALAMLFMMTSSPLQLHAAAPTRDSADAYITRWVNARAASTDANDFLYQFEASRDYDPSSRLERIRAPVLAINSADDLVNPPELGLMERLMPRVRRGRYVLIPTGEHTRGHGTHSLPALWKPHLAQLLAEIGPPRGASSADANQRLDSLAEAYFEATLPLNPLTATSIGDARYNHLYAAGFEPDVRARSRALVAEYERRLGAISRGALDPGHQLTHDVFRRSLESQRLGERFPNHLLPLNQFFNFTATFAQQGSGTGQHPFRTAKDYDDFLSRIQGFEQTVDAAIANMREGMAAGVVQPRVLMERVLPQLAAHVVADPAASLFWGPVTAMPAAVPPAERERLTAAYRAAIRDRVVPAFRRLHGFVRDDYLPRTRATVGLGALPNGRAWYEHMVRTVTTTALTPEQVHAIGLAEVARIHGEMRTVMRRVGWRGDLPSFMRHVQTGPQFHYATREAMLADFRAAQARIDASTSRLFDRRPAANYEIRPVEPFRERSFSGGSYTAASLDGTRPGIFHLNTYDPPSRARYGMESLLIHEGSPGHHFQISSARELTNVPRMRRFGGFTAYSEGWGLYAETLGRELGLYTDPYQYFGYLSSELWRSIRLVLDTGIHAKGWTHAEASEYARRNSATSETIIQSEVERFSAIPAQGLAYKIGQLKITELRRRAERALGPRFDVKAFHRAVLEDGALPLDVLDAKIDRWIAARRRG